MTEDTLFRIASLTKQVGAALTLHLVREAVLALDDPISHWLPEMASPRVLVAPDAALDHTVPAARPVTVRDLLAGTSGWGCVLEPTPLQAAMLSRRLPQPAAAQARGRRLWPSSPRCRWRSSPARGGCTRRAWTSSACCRPASA